MTERERLLKWARVYSYGMDDIIAYLETSIGEDEVEQRGGITIGFDETRDVWINLWWRDPVNDCAECTRLLEGATVAVLKPKKDAEQICP